MIHQKDDKITHGIQLAHEGLLNVCMYVKRHHIRPICVRSVSLQSVRVIWKNLTPQLNPSIHGVRTNWIDAWHNTARDAVGMNVFLHWLVQSYSVRLTAMLGVNFFFRLISASNLQSQRKTWEFGPMCAAENERQSELPRRVTRKSSMAMGCARTPTAACTRRPNLFHIRQIMEFVRWIEIVSARIWIWIAAISAPECRFAMDSSGNSVTCLGANRFGVAVSW